MGFFGMNGDREDLPEDEAFPILGRCNFYIFPKLGLLDLLPYCAFFYTNSRMSTR